MADKMGHQKLSQKRSAQCPKCSKQMTMAISLPRRKTVWVCPCGFEIQYREAKNLGMVEITYST